jgi:hypothetical protein
MWYRSAFKWSSSVALALLVATAAEARDLRFRVTGGVSATSGIHEDLGPSLEVGISRQLSSVLMATVDLGVEQLPSGWASGQGGIVDFVPAPAPVLDKTMLFSMIARAEVLTQGRDLPGPVLSAGLGVARFRHRDLGWTDGAVVYDVETRLAGELGAGVNIPIQSTSIKLLVHAADFLDSNRLGEYDVRWRTRLQVEF